MPEGKGDKILIFFSPINNKNDIINNNNVIINYKNILKFPQVKQK